MAISESLLPEFDNEVKATRHHRGQLSVYLRLNDVVPGVYGPSEDES